jgi:uncharacterized delta-60 repeat protein
MPRRPHRLGLEFLEDRTTPSYGLDPTFSGDGLLQTHLGNSRNQTATAVEPDGRILVQETTEGGSVVARFNPDGTPDATFGTNGQVTLPTDPDGEGHIAVGADGLIYVMVLTPVYTTSAGVYRLTPDGQIDTTFGTGGVAALPFATFWAAGLTVQPDGKVVIVGTTTVIHPSGSPEEFAVARLLPTGAADPSFGDGGRFSYAGPPGEWPSHDATYDVAVAPDGKIVVLAWATVPQTGPIEPGAPLLPDQMLVLRLGSDGSLDPSFSGDGVWAAGPDGGPPFSDAAALAVRPDGKVIVAGIVRSHDFDTSVIRLNADGSFDAGFGDGGQATAFLKNAGYISTALLPDGRVVVTTSSVTFGPQTLHVVILSPDGSRDPAFVNGSADLGIEFPGEVSPSPWPWRRIDDSEGLAVTPDGRVIIVGKSYTHLTAENPFAENDLIMAVLSDPDTVRIDPPVPPKPPIPVEPPPGTGATPHPGAGIDPTFGNAGHATVPRDFYGSGPVAGTTPDGRIVLATQNYDLRGGQFIVNRLTPDGAIDPTFGTDGTATIDLAPLGYMANYISAVVGLADGSVLLLFGATSLDAATAQVHGSDFAVIRLTPGGQIDTTFDTGGLAVISISTEPPVLSGGDPAFAYYPNGDNPTAMTVAPDGKLVIVGSAYRGVAVVRLNADGSLDTSFDGDGEQTIVFGPPSPFPPSGWYARSVRVAADGSVVVAANVGILGANGVYTGHQDMGVVRLTADGQLDASFGTNGIKLIDLNQGGPGYEAVGAVAFAPDGGILLGGTAARAGTANEDFVVVKLTATGELDTSFGDGGDRFIAFDRGGTLEDRLDGLTVDADGRVTVFGVAQFSANSSSFFWNPHDPAYELAFARLNANGSPDESFGPGGRLILRTEQSVTPAFAVQPDGKIVVAEFTPGLFMVPDHIICGLPSLPSPPKPTSHEIHLIRVTDDLPDRPEWPPVPLPVEPPIYYPPTFPPTGPIPVDPPPGTGETPPLPTEPPPCTGETPIPVDVPPGTGETPLPVDPPPGTGETPPPTTPPTPPAPPVPRPFQVTVDLNGDGVTDPVVIDGSRLAVVDGKSLADPTAGSFLVPLFSPFEDGFQGKLNVAAGDLTGDGISDLVIAADSGGGPVVVVYDGAKLAAGADPAAAQIVRFLGIDDPAFRGGARVALGDLNHDGTPDLVIAAGIGGGPRMAVYDGKSVAAGTPTRLVADFFAFEATQRDGAFPAVGDINGDGFADVICGGGPNGGPRVLVLDGKMLATGQTAAAFAAPVADFFAGNPADRNGVLLGITNADGDNRADLVVGDPTAPAAPARLFCGVSFTGAGEPAVTASFDPSGAVPLDGVFVG